MPVELFDPPFARCPLCGHLAICKLPPILLSLQPDETTMVCHPAHGGCNVGFVEDPDPAACEAGLIRLSRTDPRHRCGVCGRAVTVESGLVAQHDSGDPVVDEYEWCAGSGQVPDA